MPSVSKAQATLFAMARHNPAFAKKRGIPMKVAREFNEADKRTGILKRGAGGSTPGESGMNSQMNQGMGHGHNFFSETPLVGHAMTGSLGKADKTIRRAQSTLGAFRFAEGGKVEKPAGPSAKERREIRSMIERGKEDAVATLRRTRMALSEMTPDADAQTEDYSEPIERLRTNLTMAEGGEVEAEEAPPAGDPAMMYDEYMQLLEHLQDPNLDPELQQQIIERLAQLETKLESLGIDVGMEPGEANQPE